MNRIAGTRWLALTLILARNVGGQEAPVQFPPGDGATLAEKVCTRCHGASLILSRHMDAAAAERYWRIMVGTDPTSVEARKVIAYLSTALGKDQDGPDAQLR